VQPNKCSIDLVYNPESACKPILAVQPRVQYRHTKSEKIRNLVVEHMFDGNRSADGGIFRMVYG